MTSLVRAAARRSVLPAALLLLASFPAQDAGAQPSFPACGQFFCINSLTQSVQTVSVAYYPSRLGYYTFASGTIQLLDAISRLPADASMSMYYFKGPVTEYNTYGSGPAYFNPFPGDPTFAEGLRFNNYAPGAVVPFSLSYGMYNGFVDRFPSTYSVTLWEIRGSINGVRQEIEFGRVSNMTSVPEPGTWALLGTGLLALGGVARRRRVAA
jgi:hypothetical protein